MQETLDLSRLRGAGTLLNLEQYLGLWAIEESAFSALWTQVCGMDLLAHAQSSSVKQSASVGKAGGDDSGIMVISIRGTMTKQGSSLSDAGSTIRVRQEIRRARRDESVRGVLFLMETPGGTVAGTSELADEWHALSQEKPTITLAEDLMASAGMYAGLQSRKVYANTDSAIIGSIGTFIGLYDYSVAAAQAGIRPVVIRTGDLKASGFMGTEIGDEQKAMWQSIVNESQAGFDAAVSRTRKITASNKTVIGRGGVFSAKEAISLGLIDGIRSFDAAVAELRSMIGGNKKGSKMSSESEGRQPASLAELEAACGGASCDFLVAQLKKGATVQEASREFANQQAAQILEQKEQIKVLVAAMDALKEDHAKAMAALVESHTAELAKLRASIPSAGASAGSFPSLKDVPGKHVVEGGLSAKQRWNEAKQDLVSTGKCRDLPTAAQHLARTDPELHRAYLAELNSKT